MKPYILLPCLFLHASLATAATVAPGSEKLFVATALTAGEFTDGIEGPACDRKGNVYCVSFRHARNIARISPKGKAVLFLELPGESWGNGIRFNPAGDMFIADYTGHNVLKVDMKSKQVSVFAHNPAMNQPNDLAIAPDGTLYASDPNWKNSTGQLWRITTDGRTHRESADMGTSNGIEVSPDGRTLYVNESVQRNVWQFDITADGSLKNKRLFKRFDDFGFDGMRCDIDGNLYITRHGKGVVVKVSPQGVVLREIDVLGPHPTNICFGGRDGRTAYVTEAREKRLVQFRVDRPGLEWSRWKR
ncbi:MAG: SMP-30/gluconolactonase/LRE family protein [Verrucomicrobia bacterium]|nr:SMP-30/gluconolactonase/LRE family protein [Verrucomicrobiota bacterium]